MKSADMAGIEFVVDDRERNEDLLVGLGEMGAIKKRLPHHDIIVGPFGVERKEAMDFISSVFDGRLKEQQAASQESGKRRVLVVEGDIPRAVMRHKGNFSENLYYKVLADITAMGTSIVHTHDVRGTLKYVEGLLERAVRPIDEIEQTVLKLKRVSVYEAMLRQVPGLGPQKAEKVMEGWPSFSSLIGAGYGSLVRLLKPAAASALWEALHGPRPKPRVYAVLGDGKAAEVTEKFSPLESDLPVDWDEVKAVFSAKTANALWEKGLAERKGQKRL